MGDVARVLRRMAEVHAKKGEDAEAEKLKATAEKIREEIQGSAYNMSNDSEDSYNLLVACYYR